MTLFTPIGCVRKLLNKNSKCNFVVVFVLIRVNTCINCESKSFNMYLFTWEGTNSNQ